MKIITVWSWIMKRQKNVAKIARGLKLAIMVILSILMGTSTLIYHAPPIPSPPKQPIHGQLKEIHGIVINVKG